MSRPGSRRLMKANMKSLPIILLFTTQLLLLLLALPHRCSTTTAAPSTSNSLSASASESLEQKQHQQPMLLIEDDDREDDDEEEEQQQYFGDEYDDRLKEGQDPLIISTVSVAVGANSLENQDVDFDVDVGRNSPSSAVAMAAAGLPLPVLPQVVKIRRQPQVNYYHNQSLIDVDEVDADASKNSINSVGGSGLRRPARAAPPPSFVILNYNETVSYVYSSDPSTNSEPSENVLPNSSPDGADDNHQHNDNDGNGDDAKMCRQQDYLPQKLFNLHSCAYCYHYMRDDNDTTVSMFGRPSRKLVKRTTLWRMAGTGQEFRVAVLGQKKNIAITVFANVDNPAPEILATFAGDTERQKWVQCCRAAERCCEKIHVRASELKSRGMASNKDKNTDPDEDRKCVATWDGWQCWNSTDPGTTAHALCPNYIYFVLREAPACTVTAEKVCTGNGTWFVKFGGEWTNYASCASAVIEVQKRRTYVHVSSYLVSIISIIPALIVFFAYKQLRVHRIILHQNFLFSMLINGLLVVAFKTIVILSELRGDSHANSISTQNGIPCRLLLILTKYSRMTNYMWMFCESFYLHRLIAAAFAEQKSLLVFYIIGWVFPIIPTAMYAGFRMAKADEKCWAEPVEYMEWFLNGPSLLSLLFNMLFLINIIRVLLTKLRGNNAHANEPGQYRKAVKATLILLPLFGLHFVVTIYRPSSASGTCEWTEIYYFVNDILDGLQGFLVALIFCYLNGEVILLFKRTYSRWREQRRSGGSCLRQPSAAGRLQQMRHSRGGSMMGRSIVSTQCYSSVPASPEIITRLALTTPGAGGVHHLSTPGLNHSNSGSQDKNLNDSNAKHLVNGGSSKSLLLTATQPSSASSSCGNLLNTSSGSNQMLNNTIVQIKNNDPNNSAWTEVKLDNGQESLNCHELKPQKNVKIGHQNQKVTCNGASATGEHQL